MSDELFYTGEAGVPKNLDDFNFAELNQTEFLWETRVPGTDAEQTWDSGEHEHKTLTAAVERVMPFYAEYGMTLERAAHLALRLGLILGTGAKVSDFFEWEQHLLGGHTCSCGQFFESDEDWEEHLVRCDGTPPGPQP